MNRPRICRWLERFGAWVFKRECSIDWDAVEAYETKYYGMDDA